MLIALGSGYLAAPAVGWSKAAAGGERAVSNHPAAAPRTQEPTARHQAPPAVLPVRPMNRPVNRPMNGRLTAPVNRSVGHMSTIRHQPAFRAAAGASPIAGKQQAAGVLGGPAKYDAKKGAVIGTAMGHRR